MPPGGSRTVTKDELAKRLKKLKDEPIDAAGTQDEVLIPIVEFVMALKPGANGVLHWFCRDADGVVREAATFLLRLFAYSNDVVTGWKERMLKCLHSCSGCAQSLDKIKETSSST